MKSENSNEPLETEKENKENKSLLDNLLDNFFPMDNPTIDIKSSIDDKKVQDQNTIIEENSIEKIDKGETN